jgi:hypothetical protein
VTEAGDPTPGQGPEPVLPERRRATAELLSRFLRPTQTTSPPPGSSRATKALVNGLQRQERIIGAALGLLNLYLVIIWHNHLSVSKTASDRSEATTFLLIGLVVVVIVGIGLLLRRRALLGFACFLAGLVFLQYKLTLEFVFNAGFGGWLIVRAQQYQKAQRANRAPSTSASRGKDRSATAALRPPTASKRYTPPKRARTSGRR